MALTIDWVNKIINVPKADTLLVQSSPNEVRSHDLNNFHLELRTLEAAEAGRGYHLTTHDHQAPRTLGGVTYARFVEIINDFKVTYEDGQYAVNLVGANTNVQDKATVNQVSIRPSNSAGLVHLQEIQKGVFNDKVTIDAVNGLAGVQYPRGTGEDPVNNETDAMSIATVNKFRKYEIRGALTFLQDHPNWTFTGASAIFNDIFTLNGVDIDNSKFESAVLTGTYTGKIEAERCRIEIVTGLDGVFRHCGLKGTLTIANDADLVFDKCYGAGGIVEPILVLGSNATINIREHSGGLVIQNMTAGCELSIDLDPGKVTLDNTCTGGTLTLRGSGVFINNGTGITVDRDAFVDLKEQRFAQIAMAGNVDIASDDLSFELKDENGIVVRTFTVSSDGRLRSIQ